MRSMVVSATVSRQLSSWSKLVAAMFPLSVVVCSVLAVTAATNVLQCPGKSFENLSNKVQLEPCKKTPCKLVKGTNELITIKFTADKNIKDLKNHVTAELFGVPLPFIGVDGSSVCDKLETEAGEKAPCPLVAGTNYVYKDQFPVLGVYPLASIKVHWALQAEGRDVACFEVPAKIVTKS